MVSCGLAEECLTIIDGLVGGGASIMPDGVVRNAASISTWPYGRQAVDLVRCTQTHHLSPVTAHLETIPGQKSGSGKSRPHAKQLVADLSVENRGVCGTESHCRSAFIDSLSPMGIASTGTVKVSERKGPIPLNWPRAGRDP
jgi:hypothetical protein